MPALRSAKKENERTKVWAFQELPNLKRTLKIEYASAGIVLKIGKENSYIYHAMGRVDIVRALGHQGLPTGAFTGMVGPAGNPPVPY